MVYLNEGIKILFRMGYAFFKMFKEELARSNTMDEMQSLIGHKTANFTHLDKKVFIQLCFRPSLQRIKESFSAIQLTDEFQTNKQEIYKPIPDTSSRIIDDDVFEDIYKWLPQTFRASDPKLLYANWRDGTSLKTLIRLSEGLCSLGTFTFIQTSEGKKFGAFLPFGYKYSKGIFGGTSDVFLFKLFPEEKKFGVKFDVETNEAMNEDYFCCDLGKVYFGSGKGGGFGLVFDSELSQGHSYRSETFGNEILCCDPGEKINNFNIRYFEVFALL